MRGKVARALRRAAGYKGGTPRTYHKVVAAYQSSLQLDKEASEKANEPRFTIVQIPKVTIFHQDELRAKYKAFKKLFTRRKL